MALSGRRRSGQRNSVGTQLVARSGGQLRVPGPRSRSLAIAAALAAAASFAYAAFMVLQPGDARAVALVDHAGQAGAALVSAVACAWASRRPDKLRRGWLLLAIASASFVAGEIIYSVYAVGLQVRPPRLSVADVFFGATLLFAVAGIHFFTPSPVGRSALLRLALDGLVTFLALALIAWALVIRSIVLRPGHSVMDGLVGAIYPAAGTVVATALLLVLRVAVHRQQRRMLLLFLGFCGILVSIANYSYVAAANGGFDLNGNVLHTGWVAGFLMIAVAAIMPVRETDDARADEPIDLWQLMLPWFAILAAAMVVLVMALNGQPMDAFQTVGTALVAMLLMLSQTLAYSDARHLLIRSTQSEATLAEVIARAPAGVVRLGPDLCIREANPRLGELLSTGKENLVGTPITAYFEPDEAKALAARLATLASGEQSAAAGDAESKRKGGASVWLHWSATRVARPDETTDYLILLFEDTTARHQAEAAATASLVVLEKLNQLKSDFLRNVSHEFKTALTGIQGFSEFMRDADQLTLNDARAFAADIYRDAERLDRLVTEMIDLDRAETSRSAALQFGPVDLNDLVAHEVDEQKKVVDGITFAVDLEPGLPPVAGDAEKLSVVIRTLLDNAVRYSPDGGRISVSSGLSLNEAIVTVRDQGVGVRANFDNPIFEARDIHAGSAIRKVVGTGLGLGIARHIVEMHGGHMWAERLETGSEFLFTIPVAAPSASKPQRLKVPA